MLYRLSYVRMRAILATFRRATFGRRVGQARSSDAAAGDRAWCLPPLLHRGVHAAAPLRTAFSVLPRR
jgi:hypothetical protein